jgi:hypothetical protein
VKHLPQGLGLLGIEGPMNGMRTFGALPKRLREPLFVKGVDGGARRLWVAAQRAGDLVGVLPSVAGEQDLGAAQGEGIRRTQARSRVPRSASLEGRTKICRFILRRINFDYHLVWRFTRSWPPSLFTEPDKPGI